MQELAWSGAPQMASINSISNRTMVSRVAHFLKFSKRIVGRFRRLPATKLVVCSFTVDFPHRRVAFSRQLG